MSGQVHSDDSILPGKDARLSDFVQDLMREWGNAGQRVMNYGRHATGTSIYYDWAIPP